MRSCAYIPEVRPGISISKTRRFLASIKQFTLVSIVRTVETKRPRLINNVSKTEDTVNIALMFVCSGLSTCEFTGYIIVQTTILALAPLCQEYLRRITGADVYIYI